MSANQSPSWGTVVTAAICAALFSAVATSTLSGGDRFHFLHRKLSDDALTSNQKILHRLEGLYNLSNRTLVSVQRAGLEQQQGLELLEASKQQVEKLGDEVKAANKLIAKLQEDEDAHDREMAAANAKVEELEKKGQEESAAAKRRAEELEEENEQLAAEAEEASQALAHSLPLKERSIPRILHHMWLGDGDPPAKHSLWIESCKLQYSRQAGWEYRLWRLAEVEALIRKHRPEYMERWNSFPRHVMKIDAGKYFIMQYVGGLYLDTDTECFREGGDMLDGYDLVVQQDYPRAAVNSGVIAVRPNHPIWDVAFQIMEERKDHDPNDTGHSTGPQIVRDMIKRWHDQTLGSNGFFPDTLTKDGLVTRIYPQGEWLTPCGFSSRDCHMDTMLLKAAGQLNLTKLVGYHRFTALWLGVKDGAHPQDKDTIRAGFCKGFNSTG